MILSSKPALPCIGLAVMLSISACGKKGITADPDPDPEPETAEWQLPEYMAVFKESLAVNITLITGAGKNLLVDSGWPDFTDILMDSIRNKSDAPVTGIINTHHHLDHIGGNGLLQNGGTIIGHENHRDAYERSNPNGAVTVFTDTLSLDHAGIRLECISKAFSHSAADLIVYLPAEKILILGDLYFSSSFPFLDMDDGASVPNLLAAWDEIIQTYPDDLHIIPGHGPVTTMHQFVVYTNTVKATVAAVRAEMDKGRNYGEIAASDVLDRWNYLDTIVSRTVWIYFIYYSYNSAD